MSEGPFQRPRLRVAMIGYAFMGAVHSHAWHTAPRAYELPADVETAVLCGRSPERARQAAERLGWREWATDWREVVERVDVDVVDVCTPGDTHRDIAVAALAAGKHVLCEKPLANTVEEAEEMAAAAREAARSGVRSMVGFNYRRVPAVSYAARLVAEGRIGRVRHVRAQYLQDWLTDPGFPLVWRLRKERAGSGALGDIGAHAVDAVQYVTGERLAGVSAVQSTFVPRRPLPDSAEDGETSGETGGETGGEAADGEAAGGRLGEVTVDDATAFTGRLDGGGLAVIEATRYATGRKNALRLEVNGERGALAFDFESMNELWFHDATGPETESGFRRILVTEPAHPYLDGWWPPGHGLGYDHTFTHEVRDFVTAVAGPEDGRARPSFVDGLQVQRVLDAVARSAADACRWTAVNQPPHTAR
jgi:predicted dehydrogenase